MNAQILRSAVGGPNALSSWSLIVFLPIGLLAGLLWGLRNGLTLWPWLLAIAAVQASLVLPFWLCRVLLLRANAKGPRPILGVAFFAFLGGLRAVLVVFAGSSLGVTLPTGSVVDFIPNGIGIGVAILGIVAIVVDGSRAHRAAVQNLADLDAEFERTRAFDEAELVELEKRSIDEITSLLDQELRKLQPIAEHTPEQAATQLRSLASDIVRPLSHDLAEGEIWAPNPAAIEVTLPRWERAKAVIGGMRPANPLIPFLLIELIALPTALSERVGGVGFAAFVMLLGGGVILALSWLLDRLWPSGRTTIVRALVLVLAYVTIGTFAAWVMLTVTRIVAGLENPIWIAPFYLTAIAVGLSIRTSISAQQRAAEDRMAHAVARNAQLNARVRERSRQAQRRIAKLLHANVQAELTAAAIALSRIDRLDGESDEPSARVAQQLEELVQSLGSQFVRHQEATVSARTHVLDLVSLWAGVLNVDVRVMGDVWSVLDHDPDAMSRVDDVICEGLTNAVRHGSGSSAMLSIEFDGQDLAVRITSVGALAVGAQPGLGSRFLADSTRTWSLSDVDGQVQLTAIVVLSSASA